jgi:hypothetical protein
MDLGRDGGVDVIATHEGFDERGIAREVREQAKLNL